MSKDNSTPHQWLLRIKRDAKVAFDAISPSEKRGVFRHLRQCLLADDPYQLPFVQMVKAKQFERLRKFRVGNYRIFFFVLPQPITYLKHEYKGVLYVVRISKRKDAY